jgi:chorismate mutase
MKLDQMRKRIDSIDYKIISLLSERKKAVLKIAAMKRSLGMRVVDTTRQKKVFSERKSLAKKKSLDPLFAEKVFRLIVEDSCRMQEKAIRAKR